MDFDFTVEPGPGHRRAYRAKVRGIEARLAGSEATLTVENVSAAGLAVVDPGRSLRPGQTVTLALYIRGRLYLDGLPATVARVTPQGMAGLAFGDLDRQRELALDKLVLEIQKRGIDRTKLRQAGADADYHEER